MGRIDDGTRLESTERMSFGEPPGWSRRLGAPALRVRPPLAPSFPMLLFYEIRNRPPLQDYTHGRGLRLARSGCRAGGARLFSFPWSRASPTAAPRRSPAAAPSRRDDAARRPGSPTPAAVSRPATAAARPEPAPRGPAQ